MFVSVRFLISSAFLMMLCVIVGALLTAGSDHLWRTVSDFFQLNELLSPEDNALRDRIRGVMEKHVAPVMAKVDIRHLIIVLDCLLLSTV